MTECGLCEREVPDGYLCESCERALLDQLVALPGLYDALGGMLAPGGRAPGLTPPAGRPGSSMPVREDALDIRGPGGAVALLESWRSALHDDAGWSPVHPWGDYRARLARACRALRLNMPWIVANWPAAGAMAEEIRDLVHGIESVLEPPDRAERGTRLGNCPAVDDSGVLCGAVLRWYPGKMLACGWCGTRYPVATWAGLREWIDHDEAAEAS
ncbi:hypothetical protein OHB04_22725 [Streptomyces sp. NBC_01775]|uniref:hypothetical protein n=1 Tax=Streptomyces sp. NBC_01775 TaxID=2975939 RepID=UPI002DDA70AF|nr:hypothetical protein [Streptomyces sp. NBC_01775]WSB78309.1 hypothetical protein OHB04_22725 [Streptomyces sp. NBC_01775]